MHHIISPFILQQYEAGIYQGRLTAVGLFVDVARFSTVTSALMEHGQQGAEAMTVIMRDIYEPTVKTVYDQGGFITGYAGDAFTALFPRGGACPGCPVGAGRAGRRSEHWSAAWAIRRHFLDPPDPVNPLRRL